MSRFRSIPVSSPVLSAHKSDAKSTYADLTDCGHDSGTGTQVQADSGLDRHSGPLSGPSSPASTPDSAPKPLSAPLRDAGLRYLADAFGTPLDAGQVGDSAIRSLIESAYLGGMSGLESDLLESGQHSSVELSPIQQWSKLNKVVGPGFRQRLRIRPYDEVLSVLITETACVGVLSTGRLTEKSSVDQSARVQKTFFFSLDADGEWELTINPIDLEYQLEFRRFGRVRTADYVADQREQETTCYRPGTAKFPMDRLSLK